MSESLLRKKLIRLAHSKPELRASLLPILASDQRNLEAAVSQPKRRGGVVRVLKKTNFSYYGESIVVNPGAIGVVIKIERVRGGPNVALMDQMGPAYEHPPELPDDGPRFKFMVSFPVESVKIDH